MSVNITLSWFTRLLIEAFDMIQKKYPLIFHVQYLMVLRTKPLFIKL